MDVHGHAWLLEVNRLPGITSSKQNKVEEDIFFDGVMEGVLRLCVLPVLHPDLPPEYDSSGDWECVDSSSQAPVDHDGNPIVFNCTSTAVWKNVLKFSMYAKKIVAGPMGGGSHKKSQAD